MSWDYFEDDEIGSPDLRDTAPGAVILTLNNHIHGNHNQWKSIALLVAYAARHSLACWFEYCDDDKPYRIIRNVIDQVLSTDSQSRCSIDEADLAVCRPMENDSPIIDCRASDTLAAGEAVSHAARYAVAGLDKDAAAALSDAYAAFDVSPVESISVFKDWLFDVALPAALELRNLPPDNSLAKDGQS